MTMIHVYGLSNTALENVSIASKIAAEVLAANAGEVDVQGRFPDEGLQALADAGLYGLCLPKEVGGKGEGMRAFAGAVEEMAGGWASTALGSVLHGSPAQASPTPSLLGCRDAALQ